MKKIMIIIFSSLSIFLIFSCKTSSGTQVRQAKFNVELLYRVWDVDSIIVGNKAASGYEMGDPQYEFTKEGKRIKSFKTPPHSESVNYFIRNDSIHYDAENPLPSSAIIELTDKKLVLQNEKAVWKLYVK